jgi:hypothetical protein
MLFRQLECALPSLFGKGSSTGFIVSGVSVPKTRTLFISEILSHAAIAGRAKTLPVAPGEKRPLNSW